MPDTTWIVPIENMIPISMMVLMIQTRSRSTSDMDMSLARRMSHKLWRIHSDRWSPIKIRSSRHGITLPQMDGHSRLSSIVRKMAHRIVSISHISNQSLIQDESDILDLVMELVSHELGLRTGLCRVGITRGSYNIIWMELKYLKNRYNNL